MVVMGRLAQEDTSQPAACQTELKGSGPCGQRGGQPGSRGLQGGRESFEALELQKPLIF